MGRATESLADGAPLVAAAQGDGPVDAVCAAINQVVGDVAELVEFSVDAITEGINAIGGVTVRLRAKDPELTHAHPQEDERRGTRFTGFAVHTDILVATAEAYVSALNSLLRAQSTASPSADDADAEGDGSREAVHTPARVAPIAAGSGA